MKYGHLNRFTWLVNKRGGSLRKRSMNVSGLDGVLYDAVTNSAAYDQREATTVVPFFCDDPDAQRKPTLFLGRLSRRARKKRPNL